MSKFTEHIGSQFGNPRGIIGKICCIIMNVINRRMYKSVIRCLDKNKDVTILDIGFGNGYLIEQIYIKTKGKVYGIDISEDMKWIATRRNKIGIDQGDIKLSIGDCCDLKFQDGTFDVITSINTIYFWSDTQEGMKEIYRTLKDGGVFYNVVYSKEWLKTMSYTKKGFRFFEKENYLKYGKAAGFSEVTIKEIVSGRSYLIGYYKSKKGD